MQVITFDLEIATPVEEHPEKWQGARRGECGVSSIVLFDTLSGRFHIYGPDQLDEAVEHLNEADILIGYNCDNFDIPCLQGASKRAIVPPTWDLLKMIQHTVGRMKGWKLGEVSSRTLGITKSGTGEHAPNLYKQGRIHELIDYNLNDVHLTRRLANHVISHHFVVDPSGEQVLVEPPSGVYSA